VQIGEIETRSRAQARDIGNDQAIFSLQIRPISEGKLAYSVSEIQRLVGIGRTTVFKAIKERHLAIAKCSNGSALGTVVAK